MEQTPNNKTPDLLDTTDCLEAIDAIRWMKNFLYCIIIVCLLTSGTVFCLDRLDRINRTGCAASGICPAGPCDSVCKSAQPTPAVAAIPAVDAAKIRAAAEAVTTDPADTRPVEVEKVPADPNVKSPRPWPAIFRYKPSFLSVSVVLNISNFILILAATMYCLTLLMGLKISLTGRLGGISHISRAFFISLFALVVLLPWQVMLPGVIVGTLFTPGELLCQWHATVQDSNFWLAMCYLRFAGLWLVALFLFTWAHLRAAKWKRFTLRRLGLVR